MKATATLPIWFGLEGSTVRRLTQFISILLLGVLLTGCAKHGTDATAIAASNDPEMDARLSEWTHQLHHAMIGRKLNRDFDEFAALCKLDVPPPPPGKKYAISEKWRVVLQDK